MKAQDYKAQKVMADSRPQPRGLHIDFTLGRRTGSVGVSPGCVSTVRRPRWTGNTRSQPELRFPVIYELVIYEPAIYEPVIYEPVLAVESPSVSDVYCQRGIAMRYPVAVTKPLSVWVSLTA